jgi:hypothetical protein
VKQPSPLQRYVAFLRGINLGKRRLPTCTMRNLSSLRKLIAQHLTVQTAASSKRRTAS